MNSCWFLNEISGWCNSTFPLGTPQGTINHFKLELAELEESPGDPHEIADLIILACAYAGIYGIDLDTAVREKMEINRKRTWAPPDENGVISHVKQ